jgi:ABC transport system ATP-binding/permease protein
MMVRVESSEQVEMTTGDVVVLEVRSGSARVQAQPDQPLVIGRDSGCQLVVDDPLVSRRHAEIVFAEDGWLLRDLGSRNGTFVNGQRSAFVAVTDGGEVRLGNAEQGPIVHFALVRHDVAQATQDGAAAPVVAPVRTPTAAHDAAGRIRIGRGEGNDISLSDLKVSRNHAEIRRTDEVHEVFDLGSRNGTFLNGRQVRRAVINPGDRVSVGRHEFVFDGQRLIEFEDTGPVSLSAERLSVLLGDQILLDDVSFALEAGSLLAVIGPSGCGKSTLLKAVTGLRPANRGRVSYDGRDLYAQYAELRYRIGMVPQDDVLHRQLTVRRALRFAAALRFADDVPRAERSAKVDEVMQTLGLAQRAKQRIDTLSGGQRKRTSVALELLTEPSLLTLDEPTSGLDPALDKEVMEELRELADTGRTVIVVTHNVLHLDMCDRVLVLGIGGTLAYFGPPDELLGFFKAADYAQVFANVTDEPARWARAYRDSELYHQYIGTTLAELEAARPAPAPRSAPDAPRSAPDAPTGALPAQPRAIGRARVGRPRLDPPLRGRARHPTAPLRQFATLCLRMLAVIGADRGYTLFLVGLPLALALLTHTVPGSHGLALVTGGFFDLEAQRLLVVLVVGAAFLGIAAAIREIVGEASIYKRERAVGLSPTAYIGSKLAVFAVINTIQVIIFVYLSLLGRGGPSSALVLGSPIVEIMVPVALVAVTATVLGLLISALARTPEQTTPVLVVAVMTQLVLSGGLFELHAERVLDIVSWISPTRWGFAAGASTVDLLKMVPIEDPLWKHDAGSWWRSIVLLLLQGALLTVAARLALRRLEPGRQ